MGMLDIKTCSTAKGAVAVSSADAEFHAVVATVLRAQGLVTLATNWGFQNYVRR